MAYAEIHDDETSHTASAVMRRAVAWFAARGVTAERVLASSGRRREEPGVTGTRP